MTACLTGCTLRGRHVAATCPGDPCTGCMPRPVTPPATICDRCRSRLAGAINRAPALIIHLRDHVEPGSTPPGNGGTRGKPEAAPAPLNLAAMAAADDITALLVHWADWITSRRDIAAVKGVLRGDNGQCVGLLGLREPDLRVCALLLAHLDWATCTDEAGEMVSEITRLVRTTESRWPVEDAGEWSTIRCPDCGQKSIRVDPPAGERMSRQIACQDDQCGAWWSEDAWDRYVTGLAQAKERA